MLRLVKHQGQPELGFDASLSVEHPGSELARQRLFRIFCGLKDGNDPPENLVAAFEQRGNESALALAGELRKLAQLPCEILRKSDREAWVFGGHDGSS